MTTGKPYHSPQSSIKPGKISMLSVCMVSCNMFACRDVKSLKCGLNRSCGLCHRVNKRGFSVYENGSILCFGIMSTLINYGNYNKIFLCCVRNLIFFH